MPGAKFAVIKPYLELATNDSSLVRATIGRENDGQSTIGLTSRATNSHLPGPPGDDFPETLAITLPLLYTGNQVAGQSIHSQRYPSGEITANAIPCTRA